MRQLVASVVDALATRVELGATELAEERLRLARLALAAICSLFLLGNGLVIALIALAWWAGPAAAPWVLAGGALLMLASAAACIVHLRRLSHDAPPLLAATLAQLREDARAIGGGSGTDTGTSGGTSGGNSAG